MPSARFWPTAARCLDIVGELALSTRADSHHRPLFGLAAQANMTLRYGSGLVVCSLGFGPMRQHK
jgi:hypothetical protein